MRELRNICERLMIMGGEVLTVGDLPEYITPRHDIAEAHSEMVAPGALELREFRKVTEKNYIESTLRAYGWNVSRTSEILGVERTNLHKKIKKYGIERDD